jgi:hypothetical protein
MTALARSRVPKPPRVTAIQLERCWRRAFDSADAALRAARGSLEPDEIAARRRQLVAEREATSSILRAMDQEQRVVRGREATVVQLDEGRAPERRLAA